MRPNLLLVDDEASILITLESRLESLGYCTVACQSGDEALVRYKQSPENFDVILTDINMPGLSGASLSEHIRNCDLDIPIIWMTGDPTVISRERLDSLHICDLIAKPINWKKLGDVLCEHVNSGRR